MSRVVVLGGGPAGIYAGLLLARRGLPTTILERESRVGGLTAGTTVAGMAVDFGSHRLHPSVAPSILADLREILGDDLQRRLRRGRIRMEGSWISFPIAPVEILTRLPAHTVARFAIGALRATLTPNRSRSFADVVSTGLGSAMGELFYYPYARKIWGMEPGELSGEQARRRISADSPGKLLRKAVTRGGAGREFFYPRGGFGQIASDLAAAARDAGVEIRMGEPVEAISQTTRGLTLTVGGDDISADLVLSTIPITVLAQLLAPPQRLLPALDWLRYRAMVLVYLVVPAERWTDFDAHYFPGDDVPFTRVSEPKNYRDAPDPSDRTVLCVELPCDPYDEVWSRPDESLLSLVQEGLIDQGLPDPGSHGQVHRISHVYPIYRVGSEDALADVAGWLEGLPRVVTFGRQGLFAHDNTHHALVMARDAVSCVSDDLGFDMAAWERARERFAEHAVED